MARVHALAQRIILRTFPETIHILQWRVRVLRTKRCVRCVPLSEALGTKLSVAVWCTRSAQTLSHAFYYEVYEPPRQDTEGVDFPASGVVRTV